MITSKKYVCNQCWFICTMFVYCNIWIVLIAMKLIVCYFRPQLSRHQRGRRRSFSEGRFLELHQKSDGAFQWSRDEQVHVLDNATRGVFCWNRLEKQKLCEEKVELVLILSSSPTDPSAFPVCGVSAAGIASLSPDKQTTSSPLMLLSGWSLQSRSNDDLHSSTPQTLGVLKAASLAQRLNYLKGWGSERRAVPWRLSTKAEEGTAFVYDHQPDPSRSDLAASSLRCSLLISKRNKGIKNNTFSHATRKREAISRSSYEFFGHR